MCVTPITINKDKPEQMVVGCGRCIPCHLKYVNQWSFRFRIHANQNVTHYCVTLTYKGSCLPYVKGDNGTIYKTLRRSHASGFFKTLRNNHKKRYPEKAPKISYLIAGEYGDKFKRPHYHAVIFGAHADDIVKSWTYGAVYFGTNDVESTVNYALKYTMKSRLWKSYSDRYYERPFMNVSKGIGESLIDRGKKVYTYVDTATGEIKKHKISCVYGNLPAIIDYSGIKMQLPRYYTKKLDMRLDTEEMKMLSIEKGRKLDEHIQFMGLTPAQWKKTYQNWLWKLKNDQHYDNRIISDVPRNIMDIIT